MQAARGGVAELVTFADAGTLQALFARARDAVDASPTATEATPVPGVDPDTIPNHYVRQAIRAYQEVIRMA